MKARLKGIEGSKARSKRDKSLKVFSKREVGLENALPWMVKGSKVHLKEVEKYRDFSGGLILMGGLPRMKNSQK